MGKIKNKLIDWKNRLKDRHMLSIIVVLFTIIVILGIVIYKKQTEYRQASENQYNMAFYELVDYVQNVETYLAKSLISSSPEHGAETLTHVWREANLAQAYLSRLPIDNVELEKTSKFLNQVSDYSYSLSRKNIYKKALTDEDLNNLEELHNYSVDLKNTLDQLSADINGGRIKWGELTKKGEVAFAQEVSNISKNSFSNLEENFHEYSGLIYDGAFSEHMTSSQKKGLTGDNIDEEKAKQIAIDFIGKDRVQAINFNGKSENTDIITYDFSVKVNSENEENMNISITEKGGHVLLMNYNRNVEAELISQEEADKKGKEFLESRGLNNMKETYYLKQDGIVTINYAYKQDEVTVYPDLIKLKVALDNGEIMGIETKGYLNSHEKRKIDDIKVSKEKAKEGLNKNLEIINHKPVFLYSVEVFEQSKEVQEILLAVKKEEIEEVKAILNKRRNKVPIQIVEGGDTRQESVYHALLQTQANIVFVHDGARPAIKERYIKDLLKEMKDFKGANVAVKSKDTVKITDDKQIVLNTTYRANTWLSQTPQCFHRDILLEIHEKERRKS